MAKIRSISDENSPPGRLGVSLCLVGLGLLVANTYMQDWSKRQPTQVLSDARVEMVSVNHDSSIIKFSGLEEKVYFPHTVWHKNISPGDQVDAYIKKRSPIFSGYTGLSIYRNQ